jgi:hypothetical protein
LQLAEINGGAADLNSEGVAAGDLAVGRNRRELERVLSGYWLNRWVQTAHCSCYRTQSGASVYEICAERDVYCSLYGLLAYELIIRDGQALPLPHRR